MKEALPETSPNLVGVPNPLALGPASEAWNLSTPNRPPDKIQKNVSSYPLLLNLLTETRVPSFFSLSMV